MRNAEWQRRFFELRADVDQRLLEGTALAYGDVAQIPGGEEMIEAGAFGAVDRLDLVLNVQHNRGRPLARTGGGGLVLTDSLEALTVAATLPNTREADDTLELVIKKVLRGFSIEFLPVRQRQEGRRAVITSARLGGLAVVDQPAYPASTVEARAEEHASRRRRLWL